MQVSYSGYYISLRLVMPVRFLFSATSLFLGQVFTALANFREEQTWQVDLLFFIL
ncbi:hypothetical protein BvCmsSIP019_03563 [Escherichia coli]|nr:hypothetical protein BvCms244_01192 [Escherichia coli]GDW71933.1 hypothetical protein BvCmsSIP019_03563 [Escherichia coli]